MAPARPHPLEQLEDRLVPASFNVPWPEGSQLTLSFAPDGTAAGAQLSALFRTLDAGLSTRAWEDEILRAFQTWAAAADVNVGVVPDGGQPFGVLGLKQGDPRFGDIRIGAVPLASDVLAVADPYDPFVANTWVGDVLLNTNANLSIGGGGGTYDLFSVLLHEAGHVLGIGPSSDPNSPMFEHYHVVRGLTAGDVAALRALYGVRQPDAFEGPGGNGSRTTATPLHPTAAAPAEVDAQVGTLQDADLFRVAVPAGATALDVRVKAAGISLLVPRLTVYDASGHVVASAVATDPLDNDLSLHLDHVAAGDTYFVKVEGGTHDVFGIGTYRLEVAAGPAAPPAGGTGQGPSAGPAGPIDSPGGGIQLLATTPGYVEHTYYEASNTLSAAAPAQAYRVLSADLGPDMTNVMTVVVRPLDGQDVGLRAVVYDAGGTKVDATVIPTRDGLYEIQVPRVLSARDYDVVVTADNLGPAGQGARYEVAIDFDLDARHLQTFVNDSLGWDTYAVGRTLQVVESQQFQFVLAASDWGAAATTGVRLSITDAAGRDVFTLVVAPGATRSAEVFLGAGRYSVRFTRSADQWGALTPVLFELSGLTLSDSLGPQLKDTTLQPLESSGATAVPAPSFFWLPGGPTNPLAGGTPAPGPSSPGSGTGRNAVSGGEGIVQAPEAPAAARAAALGVGLDPSRSPAPSMAAGGASDGGRTPFPGLWRAGGARGTEATLEAPALAEESPTAESCTDGDGPGETVPAEAHRPDPPAGAGTTAVSAKAAPRGAAASRPVQAALATTRARLIWALGLGTTTLSWLMLRAGGYGGAAAAPGRPVGCKNREEDEGRGPKAR